MNAADFIKFVWDALPADVRMRISKLSEQEKKSIESVIISLLSKGANTLSFFFNARC